MGIGTLVGRAIPVALDALAAGTIAGVLAYLALPAALVGNRVVLAAIAFGVVTGSTLAVALALAGRGQQPFPALRLAKRALSWLPW